MSNCYATLLETVSIQPYVFSSNRLRENLGASHLVKEIYRTYLAKALCSVTGKASDGEPRNLDSWKETESDTPECSEGVEIGYIGGGNALLFFQGQELAQKFIEEWTKTLLLRVPGLTTAVVCSSFPKSADRFQESLGRLFVELERNKNQHSPLTSLPRHGITTECLRSSSSAEIHNASAGTNAKLNAAESFAKEIRKRYESQLGGWFCFSDKLEDLGGVRGEDSHIAIVHVDGNDIGQRFKEARTLGAIRRLSKAISLATESAFDAVATLAMTEHTRIMGLLGLEKSRSILPIRSIITGGDDVTFVCDGKLGIYFAKTFIEKFQCGNVSDVERLTACAGVAIIPTKYPFYRGVQLAHELCAHAKHVRKEKRSDASFLDFQVSLGAIPGKLSEWRESYYEVPQGKLLYRPFKIVPREPFDEYSLDIFLEKAWQLKQPAGRGKPLPNSKIRELRDVLALSEESGRKFVQELRFRGRTLPDIEGQRYAEVLFDNGQTPYFDMIEILRFYPEFALREIGKQR